MKIGNTFDIPVGLAMLRASNSDLFVLDVEGKLLVNTPGERCPSPSFGWRTQPWGVCPTINDHLAPFTVIAILNGDESKLELATIAGRASRSARVKKLTINPVPNADDV